MARLLPDPPSRTGGILTKRELDAALRVLSALRQPQPATVMLSWDNDMQDILQGLGRARYVETLPAYGGHKPKSSAPFKPDVMKTTPLGLEYLESIQTVQSARPPHHHATKKSPAQLDREIATALAQQPGRGAHYYVCYWEVDGRKHSWPVDAKDAISAARTFAAEYDVTNTPKNPTAVCVVVPQKGEGRGPSGPPERFRTYTTGGKLRVEPLGNRRSVSRSQEKPFQPSRQRKASTEELKAEARALQALGTAAPKHRALAIDRQLREVLSGIDPFWVRWSAFIDGEGGGRIGPSWRTRS
jgi:hypothetical protein